MFKLLAACLLALLGRSSSAECIVSRRLPAFALRMQRKEHTDVARATEISSRERGGACHMGRLSRVTNEPEQAHESTQTCVRNSTSLACAVLLQNSSQPSASRQHLRYYAAHTPDDGEQHAREPHLRRAQCVSCAPQVVDKVLTRFMGTKQITGRKQLSLGVPQRISAARLVAAQLHRVVCGANTTCPPLDNALQSDAMQRQLVLPALLHADHNPHPRSTAPRVDELWERPWVFCPVTRTWDGGAQAGFGHCSGSVNQTTWLNPRSRGAACAQHITGRSSAASVLNFCLLHQKTTALCKKMVEWQRRAQNNACQAAGVCSVSDFFYSPTTFNLREQQFVYDSVLDFYNSSTDRECQTPPANDQQRANEDTMGRCASVHIEPLLVIVEQLREGKRIVLLIGYHCVRVAFYLGQLLVAATVDAAASLANAGTDTLGRVADSLLREIRALMQQIGKFVDQLRDSIMELAFSRGAGQTLKKVLQGLCKFVEVLHNVIWSSLVCPIIQFALMLAQGWITLFDLLIDIVRHVLSRADKQRADSFIETLQKMIGGLKRGLGECATKDMQCFFEPAFGDYDSDVGALPMPTRCWSTYLTFFGDNQQLSCTKADTCKLGRLESLSQRRVCGACPVQSNPDVHDFACDALTGMCTCGVPEQRQTWCFSNEDCVLSETSCKLINDDQQLSTVSVSCDACQYQRMCYQTREGGVCACGARQQHFQQCSAENYQQKQQLMLRLNNLCLYSDMVGQLEFSLASVIPCQELDALSSSCAYVADKGAFMATGFRRLRRRLLAADGQHVFDYKTVDSTCRDALNSDLFPYTRIRCQQAFDASNATLALLGLDRQLPACTLCSFADFVEATQRNALGVTHLLTPRALAIVLSRHGPVEQAVRFCTVLHREVLAVAQHVLRQRARHNYTQVVFIERSAAGISVTVDDAVIAPHIARALENWLEAVLPQLQPHLDAHNASASGNSTGLHANSDSNSTGRPSRRLLLFRELVLAVEQRVRVGWEQASSMHEAFGQTISQLLTYNYQTTAGQEWPPPLQSFGNDQCDELGVLLAVCSETVEGVFNGWLTLTHERAKLQAEPAKSLRAAWPRLLRPQGADGVPDEALAFNVSDDFLLQTCADAANATLRALNITPHIVYDLFYSVASAANESFTCPYAAVQTCSGWRRRLWQSVIIVLVWFSAATLLTSMLGLSFANGLLVPFFATVTLQLCYGYTWACVPMVPVCAWQDFTETVVALLPLSLEVPTTLKKIDSECLTRKSNCDPATDECQELARYPQAKCLKTCRDKPFAFHSWTNVLAWALAEVGPWATDFAFAHAHRVPLFHHKEFKKDLDVRIITLERTSRDSVSAHRVCAVLSAYMILPYVLLVVLVVLAVGSIAQALTSMLFPFFLVFSALFTSVLVSDKDHEKLLSLEATLRSLQPKTKTRAARKRREHTQDHDTRLEMEP